MARAKALGTPTAQPRDATMIVTLGTAGLTALDKGDIEGARASLRGVVSFGVGMDARTGKRDPSKRRAKRATRKSAKKSGK